MDDLRDVTRTVYGLYYPETRRIVDALWAERPHGWYERNYTGRQDRMHEGFLEGWRGWVAEAGVSLGTGYGHAYPTAGANEAIHALLAQHAVKSRDGVGRVHVLDGEYEGYTHVARGLGLEVVNHERERIDTGDLGSLKEAGRPGDQLWISQPSAIDGNVWAGFDAFRRSLADTCPGVALVVDLTYVGAVPELAQIDLDDPTIAALVFSLSKPFGVYYHRIGGVLTREEVPTLGGHHWFKNLFAVHLGERLMAAHPARDLPRRYRALQERVLARAREAGEIPRGTRPSDVVLLAHADAHGGAAYAPFARDRGLRFCLSPGMDREMNP